MQVDTEHWTRHLSACRDAVARARVALGRALLAGEDGGAERVALAAAEEARDDAEAVLLALRHSPSAEAVAEVPVDPMARAAAVQAFETLRAAFDGAVVAARTPDAKGELAARLLVAAGRTRNGVCERAALQAVKRHAGVSLRAAQQRAAILRAADIGTAGA